MSSLIARGGLVLAAYALVACTVADTDAPEKNGAEPRGEDAAKELSPNAASSPEQALDPWVGEIDSLHEIELPDAKLSAARDLPIPAGALGFTTLVHVDDPAQVIGIDSLRSAKSDGFTISDYANVGHSMQIYAGLGWISAADPQSDTAVAFPVSGGAWRLQLGDDGKTVGPAHASVWVRRTADGIFHGGVVDVNVFLAPGSPKQGYVHRVLGKVFPAFGGLELGHVVYYSLPDKYSYIDDETKYRELIASSAGIGTLPALNLFVVGSFAKVFNGAIGMAAGIPGNTVESGTPLSGLAYAPQNDESYDATVLLHEMGHLAGLFHTTEFHLTETDPLSDTPECDHSVITTNPEACPDLTNVMFPIAYGATHFTPHQLDVLHGSTLYRGALSEGAPPSGPLPGKPLAPGLLSAEERGMKEFEPVTSEPRVATRPSPSVFDAAPDRLDRVLGGVWCGTGGADYEALAIRIAGVDASSRLRAIALEHTRADVVRARAFGAFVRVAEDDSDLPDAMSVAASLAGDDAEISTVRVAALHALAQHDATRARIISQALEGTHDLALAAARRAVQKDLDR